MARRPPHRTRSIEHLNGEESRQVLKSLLQAHPELAGEAEGRARTALGAVTAEGVADEVYGSLEAEDDIDNLNSRAGPGAGGYVEPSEAACEICEEAVEPFVADIKRRIKMGNHPGALAVGQGTVWGLYRARGLHGGTIEWAGDDCLCDQAGFVLQTLLECMNSGASGKSSKALPIASGFFHEKTPDWCPWIEKLIEKPRRAGAKGKSGS